MSVKTFLGRDANQNFREDLFNHKLLYDLKLAIIAAKDTSLLTYRCDVDHDGFDIIVDDRDTLRKIQLKTVARWSKKARWEIHRSILRPELENHERLGFEAGTNWGVEGGVVLIDFDVKATGEVEVQYEFSDIYVIKAIALGMLERSASTKKAVQALIMSLPEGASGESINVPRGAFVKAASPGHLLALIGLHSEVPGNWRNSVFQVAAGEADDATDSIKLCAEIAKKAFKKVIQDASGQDKP